ncbi:hypothetical protein TVAG_156100 [Trichomonas vaginalis G3]|uniref:Initiator binding domain-containing protein n=1 Tax=Trichomonas vaginalis (strain ATCC PRA-98 / G3) TaxID=412133 RepID=A2FPD3_TRIV3|nr:transcription-initiator DNA-binding domain ibd family [Trichomonas vaginalis G3]EAX93246.1 hypothetical protein TVAG_156100 [Trichomonas vaginalis G3]KAI5516862.1 transcription-initiator DNA-binding domain ibd family [Trichomonas vaginalis G3]|eukprot:XP_001306176.1 hypothetical protein [Trichomonas vaginalis G3]
MESPPYLDILVEEDRGRYLELRNNLCSDKMRYQRFRRTDTFDLILEEIHKFCIRNDSDDWKRCLVCGVCWLSSYIGINVKQLRILTDKSKSNINGVLAKLGYVQVQNTQHKKELIEAIPFLKGNYLEQRFWTIRSNPINTPCYSSGSDSASSPEMASSPETTSIPEVNYSQTPQPIIPRNLVGISADPNVYDMPNLFNVLDLKIRDGAVCGLEPSEIDFFADPVCCCPAGWIIPSISSQELLSYG